MAPTLSQSLADKAADFPESSYGANRVTLILVDGRRVHQVYLAWGHTIVKVGTKQIRRDGDLDFSPSDVVDVISEV